MRWQMKALIQQCVAHLPEQLSRPIYFRLQRHFGNLRRSRIDPTSRLRFGLEFCRQVTQHGRSPVGATFFEVGTGWSLNVPIACWLCGADRIITIDLNRHQKQSIVKEDILFIQRNQQPLLDRFRSEFGTLIQPDRWRWLVHHTPTTAAELFSWLNIQYVAPADARCTPYETHSVDIHLSCNVLEHIPEATLHGIFREAKRITKPTGLLLHRVDHTDHFSHADAALSPIHFLRYSDSQWQHYAGHRYAYVNRLREDDYTRVFRQCGLEICATGSQPDAAVARLLHRGLPLDVRFRGKTPDVLSRLTSLFVLAPRAAAGVAEKVA